MKNLVGVIDPFTFDQKLYLFSDGELVMDLSATMRDLPARIVKIAGSDEVNSITLRGNIDFTSKIKEEIRQQELVQYGAKRLEITLV